MNKSFVLLFKNKNMNFKIKIKKLEIIQTPYLTTSEDFEFQNMF